MFLLLPSIFSDRNQISLSSRKAGNDWNKCGVLCSLVSFGHVFNVHVHEGSLKDAK